MSINSAGYMVHDNELIHGYGPTADAAWTDMLHTIEQAAITLLPDDVDASDQLGSWTRESNMRITSATQSMLALIESHGGGCGWHIRNGVACTREEAEQIDAS